MSRNTSIIIVVVLVLIVAGWLLTRPKQSATPVPTTQPTQTSTSTESASPAASEGATMSEKKVVNISSSGFTPQNMTVKVGDTVTWMNADSTSHTVNSDPHPTHTLYPILNTVGLIKAGEKKSLQFTSAGTYKYHDHLNPSLTGSVTVQ